MVLYYVLYLWPRVERERLHYGRSKNAGLCIDISAKKKCVRVLICLFHEALFCDVVFA